MTSEERIQKVLESVVLELVDKPDLVNVKYYKGDQTTVFQVYVAQSDYGKVVGKQGATAEALRRILAAVSAKFRMRCVVEIMD